MSANKNSIQAADCRRRLTEQTANNIVLFTSRSYCSEWKTISKQQGDLQQDEMVDALVEREKRDAFRKAVFQEVDTSMRFE